MSADHLCFLPCVMTPSPSAPCPSSEYTELLCSLRLPCRHAENERVHRGVKCHQRTQAWKPCGPTLNTCFLLLSMRKLCLRARAIPRQNSGALSVVVPKRRCVVTEIGSSPSLRAVGNLPPRCDWKKTNCADRACLRNALACRLPWSHLQNYQCRHARTHACTHTHTHTHTRTRDCTCA